MEGQRAVSLGSNQSSDQPRAQSASPPESPKPAETHAREHRPCGEDMQEQSLAVVYGNPGAEKYKEESDGTGQQPGKRVARALPRAIEEPKDTKEQYSDRYGDREIEPGIVPGNVAVGHDLTEILDHDRGPGHRGSPVDLPTGQGVIPEPGPPGKEKRHTGDQPESQHRTGPSPGEPCQGPGRHDRKQEPGVDLGQESQRPDRAR